MSRSLFRQFCLELNGLAVKLQVSLTVSPSISTPLSVWWSYLMRLVSRPPEWVPSRHLHQMTATEQWIFLCAAHKTPKEASPLHSSPLFSQLYLCGRKWNELVFCCFVHSAPLLITPGTRWMELPAFSIATNTSQAGQLRYDKVVHHWYSKHPDNWLERIWMVILQSCHICRVSIKESSVAKLGSVCRRIYRIFSHAYFHHRQIFDKYEVGILWSIFMGGVRNCCLGSSADCAVSTRQYLIIFLCKNRLLLSATPPSVLEPLSAYCWTHWAPAGLLSV